MKLRRLLATVGVATCFALTPTVALGHETWSALTTDRVFPDSTPPTRATNTVSLIAARGEAEGAQVAVRPSSPVTVPATIGDLVGPEMIPAAQVSVYRVGYTTLTKPSTGMGPLRGDGRYGDALIPVGPGGVALPAGETTSLYVLVDIPVGTAPGEYRGTLDLGAAGSVPVVVTVAPVTANRDEFPIVARLSTLRLAESLGVQTSDPAFQQGLYGDLLPMLRSRGISPGRAPLADPTVDDATGVITFGARSDANLNAFMALGFPHVEVPFLPNYPTYGRGTVGDRTYSLAAQRTRTADGIAHRFGAAAPRSYALVVDEPTVAEYPVVKRAAGYLARTNPRIPVMVTEAPSARAVRDIGNAVDIWAPPLWDLYKDPAASKRVVRQGKRLWWYTYGSDTQRYTPNLLIDKSGTDPRMLGWLAQREGVQAFFYWGLNHWRDNGAFRPPTTDPWYLSHTKSDVRCGRTRRTVGGNGEASLIWPGPGPHQPAYGSLRLEALRDGAEDYSLLRQLHETDPAAYAQVMKGLVRPFTGTTDGDQGDACGDYARPGYLPVVSDSPAELDAARRVVIARLSEQPLTTLTGRVTSRQAVETGRRSASRGRAVRGVHGAIVRFGPLEAVTRPNGTWTIPNAPAVDGEITISRDPEGRIDRVGVPVTAEDLVGGTVTVPTPKLASRVSRPVIGPGLGRFRAMTRPARVRERAGTVTMTLSNRYRANGSSMFRAGGRTPSVEAHYARNRATRQARDWRRFRYLDLTVEVVGQARPGQRWYLIVTPGGHFNNSRNLAIGRRVQNIRVDLRRPHPEKGAMRRMNDVRYIRFGVQSALPRDWRANHSPTVRLRVSNMRLVR